ncbi:MAG TPA: histidine kinase N-terminal 7TM domain-containing protein [Myxococcota bacterium]
MHPAILPASLAFGTAAALAVVVALRRDKSGLHWLLLSLLATLLIWTLGVICRYTVQSQAGLEASLRLLFLGVFTAPTLWLLLAGSYSRVRWLSERRGWTILLLTPAAIGYLALLTNSGHHLVMRTVSFEVPEGGGISFAGPLLWAHVPWSYGMLAAATWIYLTGAARLVRKGERGRGLLLAVAAVLPPFASCSYVFGLLPLNYDLTASGMTISLVLLAHGVFRERLREALPITRRDVIEHLPDGVVLADAVGTILDLNPAAEAILGAPAASLRRRPLLAVMETPALAESTAALRDELGRLAEHRSPLSTELLTTGDRRIQLTALQVRDARGETVGQYLLLRDRTEERRFERIARQTQRMQTVGTLAAGIAHEVNNPLAFIRANLTEIQRLGEIAEAHREGPEAKLAAELADLPGIAAETLDGIHRIERIVSGMRRLSTPRGEPVARVDLNEVARDSLRLANLHRDSSVGVEVGLWPEPLWVVGSARRLVQAVLNVVMNAHQALEHRRDGRISIATRADGDQVVIEVTDNGPGIPRQLQERIFDPFFTTKDPDRGTGLGLAIAFDIARDHGGLLDVRSREGDGATFALRLPGLPGTARA